MTKDIFMIFLGIFLIATWTNAQQSCSTPNNKDGNCVFLNDCKKLFDIYQNKYRSPEETRLLRNSQCGQENRIPKVCCESESPPDTQQEGSCTTPDGVSGNCKGIYSCPTLNKLLELSRPLPQEIVTYLRQSSCQGSEKYSVCCNELTPSVASKETPTTSDPDIGSLLPSRDICGKESLSDKIVGGDVAGISQFPWLAIVEYTGRRGNILMSCGASLISKRYVVTAGHCVKGAVLTQVGKPTNIRLGEFDKGNPGKDCVQIFRGQECNDEPVVVPIEKIIAHPEYSGASGPKNDIALIRMTTEVTFTDYIVPICLPQTDKTEGISARSADFIVAGWGTTETGKGSNKKLFVKIPYIDLSLCQSSYDEARFTTSLWDKQLCAGGDKGKDSCRGDSGGPLMDKNTNNQYELIGVVSFGPSPCGREGVPGVYSKVFSYLDWIQSNLEV